MEVLTGRTEGSALWEGLSLMEVLTGRTEGSALWERLSLQEGLRDVGGAEGCGRG